MMLSVYLHDFEFGPGLHRSHFTIQPGFLHSTLYSTELLWEILKRTGPGTGSCWAPPVSPPQLDQCHCSLHAAFLTFCDDLAGVTPRANVLLCSQDSFRQCPNSSYVQLLLHPPLHHSFPSMGLIWYEYHNHDINKTWIWHEYHNQVMPIFNHLIFQLPAKLPHVCNRMPVSSVWGSSFLHPLKAGTAFSFLRHPHSLVCSWVLHRLLQLVPWVP